MMTGIPANGSRRRAPAFTCTDLIAIITVLAVLLAMQLPSAAGTKGKGQTANCLANHRQLVRAWQLYAQDNGGRLVGNLDGSGVTSVANSNKTWVLGWLDFTGGVPNGASTNTLFLTTYSPLAPYLEQQ